MGVRRIVIVVIEDNPTDVFLIKEALATHGLVADLRVLEDGEQGLSLVEDLDMDSSAARPDLILVDINLPRADGFQVLAGIRRSFRCADLPVLVMTSSPAEADKAQSMSLGANAFFQKPSGYDAFLDLGAIIKSLLA